MGILENTTLRLINCEVKTAADNNILLEGDNGQQLLLPGKIRPYISYLKTGTTLKKLTIDIIREKNIPPNYGMILRLLEKLVELNFIAQQDRLKKLLDEFKQGNRWQSSSLENGPDLLRLDSGVKAQKPSITAGSLLAVLVMALCFFQLDKLLSFRAGNDFLLINNSFSFSLLAVYLFASVALSFQSLTSAVLMFLHSGHFPNLSFRLSWIGAHLRITNWSDYKGPMSVLLVLAHSALLLFSTRLAMAIEPKLSIGSDLIVVTGLLLLAQWSPFSDTSLTRIIGRFARSGQDGVSLGNGTTKFIYFLANVLWLFVFFIFFESFFLQLIGNVTDVITVSPTPEKVFAAALGIYFIGYILLLGKDILDFFLISQDTEDLLELWDDKNKSIDGLINYSQTAGASEILSQTPPFKFMKPELVKSIATSCHRISPRQGTTLCHQGKIEDDMYILLKGRAGVYKHRRFSKWNKVVELAPGSVFGEVGFFTSQPRMAYVICQENCEVLRIGYGKRGDLKRLPDDVFLAMQDRIWLMQTLSSSEIWRDVPSEALDMFLRAGQTFDLKVNTPIINQGDLPNGFYVIIQGMASAIKDGRQLRMLERGDIFGEIAMLKNIRRTASVVASSDIKLLHVPQENFWEVLSENFGFALYIEQIARDRLSQK